MEKYFCSYTQSLSLKELGFEKECLASISVDMGTYIPSKGGRYKNTNFNNNHTVSNPLKSQAFGFFRDKFKLHCSITSISQESWQWHVKTISEEDYNSGGFF